MPLLSPLRLDRGALVGRVLRRLVREVHHRRANALSLRYKARFHPHDYWVWESLRDYHPAVVVIEYNPYFSTTECKALRFDQHHVYDGESASYGASAAALEKLGRSKGYRLVAYTGFLNLFPVREDLAAGKFERLPVACVPRQRGTNPLRYSAFVDV